MNFQFYYREDLQIGHRNQQAICSVVHHNPTDPPAYAIVQNNRPFFTKQLEMLGTVCFNLSFVAEIANNKAKTHQYISSLGIPMSDTVYCRGPIQVKLPFPLLLKKYMDAVEKWIFSGKVGTISSIANRRGMADSKTSTFGKDVRVFVVGKK